jgi:hypothetical protein
MTSEDRRRSPKTNSQSLGTVIFYVLHCTYYVFYRIDPDPAGFTLTRFTTEGQDEICWDLGSRIRSKSALIWHRHFFVALKTPQI